MANALLDCGTTCVLLGGEQSEIARLYRAFLMPNFDIRKSLVQGPFCDPLCKPRVKNYAQRRKLFPYDAGAGRSHRGCNAKIFKLPYRLLEIRSATRRAMRYIAQTATRHGSLLEVIPKRNQ